MLRENNGRVRGQETLRLTGSLLCAIIVFLLRSTMSEAQAVLYAKLAQLQALTDLDDDRIQDAISALAQAIEDVVR